MKSVSTLLDSIDWDFSNSSSSKDLHSIHPYPAKFIPEIPRRLIDLFHLGRDYAVMDPFCGSGTTLLEANRMGYDAIGIDLHPLACLIAKVKTTPISTGFPEEILCLVETAKDRMNNGNYEIPNIPRLDHWFQKNVQKALSSIKEEISLIQDVDKQDALKIALSSIIVQISNQESDTRYAAIEKEITDEDVFMRFEKAALSISQEVSNIGRTLFQDFGSTTILNRNILEISSSDIQQQVGLIITSPPYPNAYEYWLYHKYRMYWLDMDPIKVREKEIGARPHYHKKNPQDENDFEDQMQECFRLFADVIAPKGKVCFLVGRSIIRGKYIDNVEILKRAALANGFSVDGIAERQIRKTRKSFNPSHGSINKEHLVIFSLRD